MTIIRPAMEIQHAREAVDTREIREMDLQGSIDQRAQILSQTLFFFGTFNPFHMGHGLMIQAALDRADVTRVVVCPSGDPPNRQGDASLIAAHHRLHMAKLALGGEPRAWMSAMDMEQSGPSYTLDTLERMLAMPLVRFYNQTQVPVNILMGQDSFDSLPSWKGWDDLRQGCRFWVIARNEQGKQGEEGGMPQQTSLSEEPASKSLPQAVHVSMPLVGVSASQVRQRVLAGKSLRGWVSEPVRRYIDWNNLYK